MRALRVIGILEEDGNLTVVLEDPESRERFTVPGDERLRAAARGDIARLGQIAIEVGNELRPREIQARIRAGASVAELAEAAGLPEQKIERFAYPVLLERSRTAELGRFAHPVRRDGPDPRTLAEVVTATFELRGQAYDDAVWDSWKGEDGRWVVTLSWTAGRSDNRAHWTLQPGANGGTVTALDEHASDLVEGLPARPLRPIGPVIDLAREEPAGAQGEPPRRADVARVAGERIDRRTEPRTEPPPVERRGDDGRRAELHRTAEPARAPEPPRTAAPEPQRAPAPEPQRVAEPRRAPEPQRAAEPRRTTEPRRTAEPPRDARPPADDPRVEPAPAAPQPAAASAAADRTDPPAEQPPAPAEPAAAPAPPARRNRKGKPVVPSWDEVLLGVKGQR